MPKRSAARLAVAALAAALLLAACGGDDSGAPLSGTPLGRVAFVRDGDLWVADLEGGDEKKLVDADSLDLGEVPSPKPIPESSFVPYIERPEWSADGEWLSFAVPRPVLGPVGGLASWFWVFVVHPDGTELMEPWSEAVRYESGFYGVRDWEWSPVGAELATAVFGAPPGSFYIRVFDPAKQGDAWPWPLMPQTRSSGLNWVPDGSQIAVDLGGAYFDPSPTDMYKLVLYERTDQPYAEKEPVYEYRGSRIYPRLHTVAPDGSRILLWEISTSGPPVQPLSAVSLDGSGAKAHIIDTYYAADWAAVWSPDSTAIAAIQDGERIGWRGRRLVVATPDGDRLLDNSGEEMSEANPAWSPDGARIAFVRAPERPENTGLGEGHIWITPREGPPTQITDDPAYTERYPQWSPDGSAILFVRLPADAAERETVTPELWAMSPDGGNQRRVLKLDDYLSGIDALMADDWGYFFDWQPRSEKPLPTATPPESPTSSPAPLASPVPVNVGPEGPFPDNTALILETGCWQCDGPVTGLVRVYRKPGGDFAMEDLISGIIPASRPGSEGAPAITGYTIASDLSEMAVGVCIRGTCATDGLYSWSPDSVLAIYRSVDGGVSWNKAGEVVAGVGLHGIVAPGRYLVARSVEQNVMTYEVFPDGEPMSVPDGAKWILGVVNGEPLWWSELDSRVFRRDGSTYVDFGSGTRVVHAASGESSVVLLWLRESGDQTRYFVATMQDGSLTNYELPGVAMEIPYRAGLVLANIFYGTGSSRPALLNTSAHVVNPIGEPFTRPDFPPGRNYVVGFQTGPFARVVNTGSCLNIRDAPSLDSNVLVCAADRVLLHIDSAEPPAPGWLQVTTPSGTHGYASTQYLEVSSP